MKTYNLEIIKASKVFTKAEQSMLRIRLSHLLKKMGIISICLDNQYLFIEYDRKVFNSKSLHPLLVTTSYLLADGMKLAS